MNIHIHIYVGMYEFILLSSRDRDSSHCGRWIFNDVMQFNRISSPAHTSASVVIGSSTPTQHYVTCLCLVIVWRRENLHDLLTKDNEPSDQELAVRHFVHRSRPFPARINQLKWWHFFPRGRCVPLIIKTDITCVSFAGGKRRRLLRRAASVVREAK